jgi:hypothetical protein
MQPITTITDWGQAFLPRLLQRLHSSSVHSEVDWFPRHSTGWLACCKGPRQTRHVTVAQGWI